MKGKWLSFSFINFCESGLFKGLWPKKIKNRVIAAARRDLQRGVANAARSGGSKAPSRRFRDPCVLGPDETESQQKQKDSFRQSETQRFRPLVVSPLIVCSQ
jgi:hypothetical protein